MTDIMRLMHIYIIHIKLMNPFAIPMMFGPNALYYQLAMFKQMQNANEPIQMRIEPVIENNEIKNAKQYPEFKETQQPAV